MRFNGRYTVFNVITGNDVLNGRKSTDSDPVTLVLANHSMQHLRLSSVCAPSRYQVVDE